MKCFKKLIIIINIFYALDAEKFIKILKESKIFILLIAIRTHEEKHADFNKENDKVPLS